MSIPRPFINASVALALTLVTLFTTSAFGQSPAARPNTQGRRFRNRHQAVAGERRRRLRADDPKSKDLESEIEAMKAENAAFRELLRKMEEQQKTLLEQVDRLQRRLDGGAATDVSNAGQPIVPPATPDASVPAANAASNTPQPATDSASTFHAAGTARRATGKRRALQRWNRNLANGRRR